MTSHRVPRDTSQGVRQGFYFTKITIIHLPVRRPKIRHSNLINYMHTVRFLVSSS